jgi:hypothetical protein
MEPFFDFGHIDGPHYHTPDGASHPSRPDNMPQSEPTKNHKGGRKKRTRGTKKGKRKGKADAAKAVEGGTGTTSPDPLQMPDPAELSDTSGYEQLCSFLKLTGDSLALSQPDAGTEPRAVSPFCLIPYPMMHLTGNEKDNWASWEDMYRMKCVSLFFTTGLGKGQTTRVGFFCTKTQSPVGQPEIPPYHAWAAVLQPLGPPQQKKGSRMLIYDVNADADVRANAENFTHLPLNMQRKLVEAARTHTKLVELWLIGDDGANPEGRCMEMTGRWIQNLLRTWALWPFPPEAYQNPQSMARPLRLDRAVGARESGTSEKKQREGRKSSGKEKTVGTESGTG